MNNERDFGQEIDSLKEAMAALSEQMMALMKDKVPCLNHDLPNPKVGHVEKMVGMIPDPHLAAELDRLENLCGESGTSGRITYLGVYASGGRQSTWMRNSVNCDELLSLVENGTAGQVLKCIGSQEKLSILLAILKQPRTVAGLVSECGFGSTGQVYHHLKTLVAANIVAEDEQQRGQYIIVPHRVQGLVMLLAGICDLTDPQYTQGSFDE